MTTSPDLLLFLEISALRHHTISHLLACLGFSQHQGHNTCRWTQWWPVPGSNNPSPNPSPSHWCRSQDPGGAPHRSSVPCALAPGSAAAPESSAATSVKNPGCGNWGRFQEYCRPCKTRAKFYPTWKPQEWLRSSLVSSLDQNFAQRVLTPQASCT